MADIKPDLSIANKTIKEEPEDLGEACDIFVNDIVVKYEPKYVEVINESLFGKHVFVNGTSQVKSLLITPSTNENNINSDSYNMNNMLLTVKSEKENYNMLVEMQQLNAFDTNSTESFNNEYLSGLVRPSVSLQTNYENTHSGDIAGDIMNECTSQIIYGIDRKSSHYLDGGNSEGVITDASDTVGQGNLCEKYELDLKPEDINIEPIIKVDQDFSIKSPLLDDATLSCSLCSFTTEKRKALECHERDHRKASIFKCPYCNHKYTKKALYLHVRTLHPEKKFQFSNIYSDKSIRSKYLGTHKFKCKKCEFSAKNIVLLKRHIKMHLSTSNYPRCSFKLTSKSLLFQQSKPKGCLYKYPRELKGEHDENTKTTPKNMINLSCPECSHVTTSTARLKQHLESHTKHKNLSCAGCGFKSTPSPLRFHQYKCEAYLLKYFKGLNEQPFEKTMTAPRRRTKFSCSECSYVTAWKLSFERHQSAHKMFEDVSCSGCGSKFTSNSIRYHQYKCEAYLLKHLKDLNEQSNKMAPKRLSNFSCPKCSYATTSTTRLKRHLRSHSKHKNLSCAGCGFKSTPESLRFHQYKCGVYLLKYPKDFNGKPSKNTKAGPKKRRKFSCPECSYVAVKVLHLKRHLESHTKHKNFSCIGCGFKSTPKSTPTYLRYHQYKCRTYLLKYAEDVSGKPSEKNRTASKNAVNISCPECSYVTKYASSLERHQQSHKRFETLYCTGCGFKFTPKTLIYHQFKCEAYLSKNLKNHIPPNFSCPECSYVATCTYLLERHQKSHKNFQNVSCAGCDFKFTPKALRFHQYKCQAYLLKHPKDLNENPSENIKAAPKNPINFSCGECSYIGKCASLLERHQKSHKISQNVSCSGCGLKFTPKTLVHHQFKCKAYLLENPKNKDQSKFSCSECSYVSASTPSLKRHEMTHKTSKNVFCPGCGFTSTPSPLRYHQYKCEAYLLKQSIELNRNPSKNVVKASCFSVVNETKDEGETGMAPMCS